MAEPATKEEETSAAPAKKGPRPKPDHEITAKSLRQRELRAGARAGLPAPPRGRPRRHAGRVSAAALRKRKQRAKAAAKKRPRPNLGAQAIAKLRAGSAMPAPRVPEGPLGSEAPVLSLLQLCQMAGLRYKAVMSYMSTHNIELRPNNGKKGRTRRYSLGAVKDLERIYSARVKRARAGNGADEQLGESRGVMAALQSIARQLRDLRKELARPMKVRLER